MSDITMKFPLFTTGKHREIMLYGLSLAAVLLLLKWLEVRLLIVDLRLELFISCIAILFTLLGIWLSLKLVKPKVETRIIEKEVIVTRPAFSHPDEQAIIRSGLSRRELEVLNAMAEGLSNEEIATRLFVSMNTIKTHTSNIFLKLDVKRRTQAVEKAKRLQIIT